MGIGQCQHHRVHTLDRRGEKLWKGHFLWGKRYMLICLCRSLSLLYFIKQKFTSDFKSQCSVSPVFFFFLMKIFFFLERVIFLVFKCYYLFSSFLEVGDYIVLKFYFFQQIIIIPLICLCLCLCVSKIYHTAQSVLFTRHFVIFSLIKIIFHFTS